MFWFPTFEFFVAFVSVYTYNLLFTDVLELKIYVENYLK